MKLILIFLFIIVIFMIYNYNKESFYMKKYESSIKNLFKISRNQIITKVAKEIFIIDNFYENPDKIRDYALANKSRFYTIFPIYKTTVHNPNLTYNVSKELIRVFEKISNKKINEKIWNKDTKKESNGYIQYINKDNNPAIHYDRHWGVIIFLHPNPKKRSGTSFYKNKKYNRSKIMTSYNAIKKYGIDKVMEIVNDKQLWKEGQRPLFDKWEETYSVENVYNRAIIFNGRQFHCSHGGFGKNIEESRLFQTFFFSPIKI